MSMQTLSRIGDQALDNPVGFGGACVMALTAGLIIWNGAFAQTGKHPAPLFGWNASLVEGSSFRGEATPHVGRDISIAVPAPKPVRKAVNDKTSEPAVDLAIDHQNGGQPQNTADAVEGEDPAIVRQLQNALKVHGYYDGPIDGVFGGQTRSSIVTYQRQNGLRTTGEPTEALLAHALRGAAPVRQETAEQKRLRKVQEALTKLGYGPVSADGVIGPETRQAVQRFQLDRNLPLTGEIDDLLIKELLIIGGLDL